MSKADSGSDFEYRYVSQLCNITPLEVEVAARQRKFHRKLCDLADVTAIGVSFRSLILLFLCVLCNLCCLYDKMK